MIRSAFQEADGNFSFARVAAGLLTLGMLSVYVFAAIQGEWETVRALNLEIALLAGGLYGLNRFNAGKP